MSVWTIAFDAALLPKMTHCSLCGTPSFRGVFAVVEAGELSLPTMRCTDCYSQPGQGPDALQAKLERRYSRRGDEESMTLEQVHEAN